MTFTKQEVTKYPIPYSIHSQIIFQAKYLGINTGQNHRLLTTGLNFKVN